MINALVKGGGLDADVCAYRETPNERGDSLTPETKEAPLSVLRGNQPCHQLDPGPLARYITVAQATQCVVLCYSAVIN